MIKLEKDKVIIQYNPQIYPDNVMLQAVESFKDVCSCSIDNQSSTIKLKPNKGIDKKTIGYELINFCLGIINNKDEYNG